MDMAAKGAYQLLQHHVCRDYKTSQRGIGMGGVHHRHNAHRLYLIPKMDEIEHVKKPSDDKHVKPMKTDLQSVIKNDKPGPGYLAESRKRDKMQEKGRKRAPASE